MCIYKINFINFKSKSSSEWASIQVKRHISVNYFFALTGFENKSVVLFFKKEKLTEKILWLNQVKSYCSQYKC